MDTIKRMIERDVVLCLMLRAVLSMLARLHFRLFCYVAEGLCSIDSTDALDEYHEFAADVADQNSCLSKRRVSHLLEMIGNIVIAMMWLIKIHQADVPPDLDFPPSPNYCV